MAIKIRTLKLRKMRHMTQQQLAQRAKLSKTTISNLESGLQTKIELETIAKLCGALECTPSELFEVTENRLFESQKAALKPFIGNLEYSKRFNLEKLDSQLADLIDIKKNRKSK